MEDDSSNNSVEREQDQKPKKRKERDLTKYWPLKAFFITIFLSIIFNLLSSIAISGTGIAVTVIVIIVLILIGTLFDMIGMAVASCTEKPFYSMAARKVKGAKVSLKLIKNSDIVGSICSDIIGDICNIISGSASASLILIISINSDNIMNTVISIAVTAVLAAVTVGLKAVCKKIAVSKSVEIVSAVGKVMSIFSRKNNW